MKAWHRNKRIAQLLERALRVSCTPQGGEPRWPAQQPPREATHTVWDGCQRGDHWQLLPVCYNAGCSMLVLLSV